MQTVIVKVVNDDGWLGAEPTVTVVAEEVDVPQLLVLLTVTLAADDTTIDCVIAFVLHTLPVAEELVSVTLPPGQIVVEPLALIVGVTGTEDTFTVNVFVVKLDAASLAVIEMVTNPDWPTTGVTITVLLLPLPPKTILLFGITLVLFDVPETTTLPIVSSITVKL